MAKTVTKDKLTKKRNIRSGVLSLEKVNYQIILGGVAVIIAGYIALSAKPWDNPIALTVAPILLAIGYCVIIPFGLIYRRKDSEGMQQDNMTEEA